MGVQLLLFHVAWKAVLAYCWFIFFPQRAVKDTIPNKNEIRGSFARGVDLPSHVCLLRTEHVLEREASPLSEIL
jgi:hypothetical protein